MIRLHIRKIALAGFAIAISLAGLQSLALAKLPLQNRQIAPNSVQVFTHKQYAIRTAVSTARASSKDTDGDGLSDWTEINRTKTNYRMADTDGDGLSDWTEVNDTKTNARRADTDGDGAKDGTEVAAGSNPRDPKSVPPPKQPPTPPSSPTDTTPPQTTIGAGPSGPTTATVASFSFVSSESSSAFACRLDGAAWATCTSPVTYPGLAVGAHSFSVRATDVSGNTDPTPASRSWTVEAPPPVTEEEAAQAVWTAPAVAQVDVPVGLDGTASSGDGPLACTWSFENQSGSAVYQTRKGCKIEFTFSEVGTKYVKLSVQDVDGETDSNKQSFAVGDSEDTTPPSTTIGSGPSGATTATSASFTFSSSEAGSSFQCQLDGSAWTSCASPKAYSGLAAGAHTFSVRATDEAANTDPTPASRAWTIEEEDTEPPPPGDTTPPNTNITSTPPSTTTQTSASFSFTSTESGSTFECKLDSGAFGSCASPKAYSGLSAAGHTFSVQATDAAGNIDLSPASYSWTVQAPEPPPPPPPPGSGCASGSTNATSASAVTSAVSAGKNVCVTVSLGDVNFTNMGKKAVVVSTEGGSMDHIEIQGTTDLTIRSARFTSVTIRGGHRTTIEGSTIGGTPANRSFDQLIFMPDESNDVTIKDNDIGWTKADNSGNTGYGCRCYGTLNRLRFVGNKIHDIAADGFQGVNGDDVLIDRNEIGPVGANPDSSEHSDNIQITGNDSNLRITNNWIHHQGYYEGKVTGNAGSTYIHGGSSSSLVYENNLVEIARGRTEICGLGTGGTSRSNITIRRNTWVDGGQAFTGFPGFEWDCDSGSGNVVERNIAVDPDGGFAQDGGSATFANNLWGQPSLVALNSQGNCTSANCNPTGQEAIGYRKPSGVRW
jgi:Right handed beta helix region/Bacterial TSP3 repeat